MVKYSKLKFRWVGQEWQWNAFLPCTLYTSQSPMEFLSFVVFVFLSLLISFFFCCFHLIALLYFCDNQLLEFPASLSSLSLSFSKLIAYCCIFFGCRAPISFRIFYTLYFVILKYILNCCLCCTAYSAWCAQKWKINCKFWHSLAWLVRSIYMNAIWDTRYDENKWKTDSN